MPWTATTPTGVLTEKVSDTSFGYNVGAAVGERIIAWVACDNLTNNTPTATISGVAAGETNTWQYLGMATSPQSAAAGASVIMAWAMTPTVTWSGVALTFTLSGAVQAKVGCAIRVGVNAGAAAAISAVGGQQVLQPSMAVAVGDFVLVIGCSEEPYAFNARPVNLQIGGTAQSMAYVDQGGTTGGSSTTNLMAVVMSNTIATAGTATAGMTSAVDGTLMIIKFTGAAPAATVYGCGLPI